MKPHFQRWPFGFFVRLEHEFTCLGFGESDATCAIVRLMFLQNFDDELLLCICGCLNVTPVQSFLGFLFYLHYVF